MGLAVRGACYSLRPMPTFCRLAGLALCSVVVVTQSIGAQDRRLVRNPGTAERRFALVVGNDAYVTTPLKNAVADARAVAQVLKEELGFSVELVTDARLEMFETSVDRFIRQLQPGDLSVFYYAGHGVEINGENFLLPVEFTAPEQQVQVKRRSVSALEILERMGERGARIRIVILDACRDNPFRAARSGSGGLHARQSSSNTSTLSTTKKCAGSRPAETGSRTPVTESRSHFERPAETL
jgi:caspase domain-containing protein